MHTISIWIEHGWTVHKFKHTFTNSSLFIEQIIFPADIFVMLQPYADQLGLASWDPDERELHLHMMKERHHVWEDEERYLSNLLEGQVNIDKLGMRQLKMILHFMEKREWNDIIFVRDVSEEKLGPEREMWSVMDGISHLALME